MAKADVANRLGWNALHRGCMSGSVEVVSTLLPEEEQERTRLLAQPDGAGYTPLHIACGYGHASVVDHLASVGAVLDAPMTKEDSAGDTPMHTACKALSDAKPERQDLYIDVIVSLIKSGGLLESEDAKGRMAAAFVTKPLQARLLARLRPPSLSEAEEDGDGEHA